MWFSKVFILFFISSVFASEIKTFEEKNANIIDFVELSIKSLNLKDSRTKDIILVHCGFEEKTKKNVDELFQSLVVPMENPVTTLKYIRKMAKVEAKIASIVLVVNDVFEMVKCKNFLKK